MNSKEALDSKFWIQHSELAIKELAVNLCAEKHIYAQWNSRGIELQTQAPPEENYVKDVISAILRIKSKKLIKIIRKHEKEVILKSIENPEEVSTYLKAIGDYKSDLAAINKILGTVVLH